MDLVTYMQKLQNMADFLVRGYVLKCADGRTAIEIVNDEIVEQANAFSIQEYNLFDPLEQGFWGEQRSIGILMEYLADGEYERQIEGKEDFSQPYKPTLQEAEFYYKTMKRVKAILKMMSISLVSGTHIPLDGFELIGLKREYLEEDDLNQYEEQVADLIYNVHTQSFCVIDSSDDIIIEDIDIHEAMYLYNEFLVKQEQTEIERKVIEEVSRSNQQDLEEDKQQEK
ncbi:MAG: hypothetical protein HFJ28_04670 [Clostridia bacterium]|jgi:hypothetical protein|nr:hypothetical protein [Clostridia bacterium]